jgi:hypothetical protein
MRKVGVLAFDASIIFALTVALAIVRGECVAAPLRQAATMHISAVAAIVDVPRIGMNWARGLTMERSNSARTF